MAPDGSGGLPAGPVRIIVRFNFEDGQGAIREHCGAWRGWTLFRSGAANP
ncbi:MAG: hypothetical protein GMKNLPBB_02080 [Myxococcota bacterium]|nr:hypothetical protein [Myxococcota bacterium]